MNAELPKLIVALYLVGADLDPVTITGILRVQPSKAQKKGQEFITASGREYKAKTGTWALVVELESEPLDVHLRRLIDALPKSTSFVGLPGAESANDPLRLTDPRGLQAEHKKKGPDRAPNRSIRKDKADVSGMRAARKETRAAARRVRVRLDGRGPARPSASFTALPSMRNPDARAACNEGTL